MLTNGARYYVDHAHPELSTPECADARSIVVFDRAAEQILQRSMEAAAALLPEGQEIVVYKNNSDGKGNSYGCHENYLMDRAVPFGRIVTHATAHFITRQIFTGAGKVGSEARGARHRRGAVPAHPAGRLLRGGGRARDHAQAADRQHPRRAPRRRPEVPAPARHRRRRQPLRGRHLPQGRHHRLRAGHGRGRRPAPRPSSSARRCGPCARSPTTSPCSGPLELADGTTVTALEVQWELLDRARKYAESTASTRSAARSAPRSSRRWEAVLTGLESDPMTLADQLDWVAKYRLLNGYRERHGLGWDDARLAAMDLQYHDLRPERSLAARGRPRAHHRPTTRSSGP